MVDASHGTAANPVETAARQLTSGAQQEGGAGLLRTPDATVRELSEADGPASPVGPISERHVFGRRSSGCPAPRASATGLDLVMELFQQFHSFVPVQVG